MLTLALDSSSKTASVALYDDKMIYTGELNDGRTHSQKLMPMVESCFEKSGRDIKEVDLFAVINGPGSFTGVRIAVTAAKALAMAVNAPIVAVDTLEALAYNVPFFEGIVAPIMDARRGQVYTALFRCGDYPERLCDDKALHISELLEELKEMNEPVLFVGCGVEPNKDIIKETMGDIAHFAPAHCALQRASAVAMLAERHYQMGEAVEPLVLVPNYVRESSAEQNLRKRS